MSTPPIRSVNTPIPLCSPEPKEKKKKLILGEGNFSYIQSWIHKHFNTSSPKNSLKWSITATEISDPRTIPHITELEKKQRIARLEQLEALGVQILFGVDATKTDAHPELKGQRFQKIHWNCPHDRSDFRNQTLPKIIHDFFLSCRNLQNPGDRVYITLAQPHLPKGSLGNDDFYQGYVYDAINASLSAGYRLVKKREFGSSRYPGYEHTQTNSSKKAPITDQGLREFVFELVSEEALPDPAAAASNLPEETNEAQQIRNRKRARFFETSSSKPHSIQEYAYYSKSRFVVECSTDNDSSNGSQQKTPSPKKPRLSQERQP